MPDWQTIPGYSAYQASDDGRVRRIATGKEIRAIPNGPYLGLSVKCDVSEKFVRRRVHVLVTLAFHGPRPLGKIALHRNDIKSDNRSGNLYWGTHSGNQYDAIRNGGKKVGYRRECPWQLGEMNQMAKLTNKEVREIRKTYAAGILNQSKLARKYGVSQAAISGLILRKTYQFVH